MRVTRKSDQTRLSRAASLAAIITVGLALSSCATDDRKGAAVAGGQTADEGSDWVYPECFLEENYGPGDNVQPWRMSNCTSETLPDGWVRGDPNPAGRYVCNCPE